MYRNFNQMDNRILGEKIELDDDAVKKFFENRKQKNLPYRYNYVNYQDAHPERVLDRDKIEKGRIVPFFEIDEDDLVLDIGCGVGRWGDYIVPRLDKGRYVGVDYTESFVQMARDNFADSDKAAFVNGSFQELTKALKTDEEYRKYDKILINGVLMYINDRDFGQCIREMDEVLLDGGFVYLKESVGVKRRLTLNKFHSDELESDYSVIYRSIAEYSELFTEYLFSKGYVIITCGPTWDSGLDLGRETDNWYWIIQKSENKE